MTHTYDPDVPESFVVANGTQLHYRTFGTGEPVLLLAGWPQTSHAWRRVVPLLIDAGRTVITVDLRGQGHSAKPGWGYDLDTMAADIHAFAHHLSLIGPGGLDVVSHDVGSWVAYALATGHPDDVKRLMLSEMTLQTSTAVRPMPDEAGNIASWHFGFNRLEHLPEALTEGRERVFIDWLLDNKSLKSAQIEEDARRHYARSFSQPGAARAGFDYYRELLSPRGLGRMDERAKQVLRVPVLAVGGKGGVRSRLADSLAPVAPSLTSVIIDAGHYLPEEASTELVDAVITWWGDTR